MTADDVTRISAIARESSEILGRITMLKERLAWLDANEPLYVAFDRGASKLGNVSTQRVPVQLLSIIERDIRKLLRDAMAAELQAAEEELERLSV